jgi:MoxR-like ATPase
MATQNPLDLIGTFPLPDSQLDRFLLSFSIGYPDPAAERSLLISEDRAKMLAATGQMLTPEEIRALQADCDAVHVSDNLLDYVQTLLAETRDERWFESGLSPRAGLALLAASRAHAFLAGRDHVIPEDVKSVFPALARHRLSSSGYSQDVGNQVRELLEQVPIP